MAGLNATAQRKYLQQQVESATAVGRVILLYDACIRFLNEAKAALVQNQKLAFAQKLIRAKDIIRELRNALNLDLDPMISGNMYRLYTFMLKKIQEAGRSKGTEDIDYVIRQLTTINNAWKEAEQKGLTKDIKRYEERMGTDDVNIVRRSLPRQGSQFEGKQSGGALLETLNLKI